MGMLVYDTQNLQQKRQQKRHSEQPLLDQLHILMEHELLEEPASHMLASVRYLPLGFFGAASIIASLSFSPVKNENGCTYETCPSPVDASLAKSNHRVAVQPLCYSWMVS